MKEFRFVPKKESGFEGHVMLKVPKYKQRIRILRECNFNIDAAGEMGKGAAQFDSIEKIIEVTESHVLSVELKYGETVIGEIEELGYYQEGVELLNEIGNLILSGFSLGKS